MSDDWDELETQDKSEDEVDMSVYQISSYPADITLKGYLEKWNKKQLVIPEFQRNYVWDQAKASKLIESFLLGLPVPGVFLYKDKATNKLAVIDGQQRIMSAIRYFNNEFDEKIFRLKSVLPKWANKTYGDLDESDQYQLDDIVLRATVVQQLDPDDDSSIYHIFERLNTGGINLNPMEIRRCVYYGALMDALAELNDYPAWRNILGKAKPDKRLRDIELILRVLALHNNWDNYEKPMKGFLNSFLTRFNKLAAADKTEELESLKENFKSTCDFIEDQLSEKPFNLRGRMNYAVLDSIMVTVMESSSIEDGFHDRYLSLISDEDYLSAVSVSTSDEKVVKLRMEKCHEILIG